MTKLNLAAMVFGLGFGFVLGWARLGNPDVIYSMLRLREPDVFLLMGSAIATAAVGARLLRARGAQALIGGMPVSWKTLAPTRNHVVGSLLFGLGWSVANTCPGPIAVQLGRGEFSGGFTAVGLLAGIALRDAASARAATGIRRAPASAAPAEATAAVGL